MHQWISASKHCCINASICECVIGSMHKLINESMQQCTYAPMHQCLNASIHQCTNVTMCQYIHRPMYQCIIVSMHHHVSASCFGDLMGRSWWKVTILTKRLNQCSRSLKRGQVMRCWTLSCFTRGGGVNYKLCTHVIIRAHSLKLENGHALIWSRRDVNEQTRLLWLVSRKWMNGIIGMT